MRNVRICKPLGIVLLLAVAIPLFAADLSLRQIEEEIAQMRKDLAQTQVESQRVKQEIDKDKKDYADYRDRTTKKQAAASAQIDAINKDVAVQASSNNALGAQISSVVSQRKQIELAQEEFRVQMVSICSSLNPSIRKLPPFVMTPTQSALSLLINDVNTKVVDNVEACARLIQIMSKMEDATTSIQVSEENSPVADIHGQAYRLRIGSLFEAVVDLKGEKAAIFDGWDTNGAAKWKTVADQNIAKAIHKTVSIREGKVVPSFVSLPLLQAEIMKGEAK